MTDKCQSLTGFAWLISWLILAKGLASQRLLPVSVPQPTAGADCERAHRTQHLVALAAVPSRGRTPLGATSTPRCAHMSKVEWWDGAWAKVRRASPSYTRRRSAAATNRVAPGPMRSHRGHRPAVRASRPCDGTVARNGRRPCPSTRRRCLPRTPGSAARS